MPTVTTLTLFASGVNYSPGVQLLFGLILVGMIVCLALEEKLHAKKSVIVAMFAVVCLLLGEVFQLLPNEAIVVGSHLVEQADQEDIPEAEREEIHEGGEEIDMPVYIPAIDWGVVVILLGSSVFVDVISRSGLFKWLAIKVTKLSRGDPLLLLTYYGVMTVVFSAVLNNVTAMVIVGSLTAVSLEKLDRQDKLMAFLLTEGLLTNIGGLLTLISSVPNIIVGTTAGISFVEFFLYSAPYVVLATAATIWLAARQFGIRRINEPLQRQTAAELVDSFDENDSIESRGFFWFGAIMTTLFILTIATTSVLPWVSDLGMGYVAVAFATVALLRYKSEADRFYRVVDWDLLGFFVGLFIVIYVMEHAGVLAALGSVLVKLVNLGPKLGSASLLFSAAVCSSVTDNIPLAAMLAKILGSLPEVTNDSPLWWAVIFGANLGGNLTPIGSASTLVAVTVMHKHEIPLSFLNFVKLAIPFAIMQLVLASVYLLLTG